MIVLRFQPLQEGSTLKREAPVRYVDYRIAFLNLTQDVRAVKQTEDIFARFFLNVLYK